LQKSHTDGMKGKANTHMEGKTTIITTLGLLGVTSPLCSIN